MENIKVIALKAGISERTVRNRADSLGIKRTYEGDIGSQERVFSPEESLLIQNWKGKKPGRKVKNG